MLGVGADLEGSGGRPQHGGDRPQHGGGRKPRASQAVGTWAVLSPQGGLRAIRLLPLEVPSVSSGGAGGPRLLWPGTTPGQVPGQWPRGVRPRSGAAGAGSRVGFCMKVEILLLRSLLHIFLK